VPVPRAAVAVETSLSHPQGVEAEDDAASMVRGVEMIGILDMLDNAAAEERVYSLVAVGVDATNLDVEELKMLKDNLVTIAVAAMILDAAELKKLVDDPSVAYFVVPEVV